jgi:hypothetical protein
MMTVSCECVVAALVAPLITVYDDSALKIRLMTQIL